MKRYVVCTMIGTGIEEDFVRPAVADYHCNWVMLIAADFQTNPNRQWVVCTVAALQETFDAMNTNSTIDVLPFGSNELGNYWLDLGSRALRNQFSNKIQQRTGVEIPVDDPRTLREIIIEIGTALNPNFNPDLMDIADII